MSARQSTSWPASCSGRHVGELALDRARLGVGRALGLGDAEVGDLGEAALGQEQVRRRDVAMHDAHQLAGAVAQLVGVVQALGDLMDHAADEAERQLALLARVLAEHREQREALEVLHHDVELVVALVELVDLADVRVRHVRRDLRLADQHRAEPAVAREVRQDPLDHEQLLEAGGALEPGQKDLAHAAGRNAGQQLVTSQTRPRDGRLLLQNVAPYTTIRRRLSAPARPGGFPPEPHRVQNTATAAVATPTAIALPNRTLVRVCLDRPR